MADDPLWETAVDRWLDCAGDVIDGIGVDHYPGTWTLGEWTDWRPLELLFELTGRRQKRAGVLETGFSSWSPTFASELDQARWVNASLPALFEASKGRRLDVVNWYPRQRRTSL